MWIQRKGYGNQRVLIFWKASWGGMGGMGSRGCGEHQRTSENAQEEILCNSTVSQRHPVQVRSSPQLDLDYILGLGLPVSGPGPGHLGLVQVCGQSSCNSCTVILISKTAATVACLSLFNVAMHIFLHQLQLSHFYQSENTVATHPFQPRGHRDWKKKTWGKSFFFFQPISVD